MRPLTDTRKISVKKSSLTKKGSLYKKSKVKSMRRKRK